MYWFMLMHMHITYDLSLLMNQRSQITKQLVDVQDISLTRKDKEHIHIELCIEYLLLGNL